MRGGEISKELNEPSISNDGVQNLRQRPFEEHTKEIEQELLKAYEKGDFAKAEKEARELIKIYPHVLPYGIVPIPIEKAQTLLALSMSKQGKYAGPEFDQAIESSTSPLGWSREEKLQEAVDQSKTVRSGKLYFEKGVNALTCKDRPNDQEAKEAFSEAIRRLRLAKGGDQEFGDKKFADKLLPEVYEYRAIAKAKLGDIYGALLDLELAKNRRVRMTSSTKGQD